MNWILCKYVLITFAVVIPINAIEVVAASSFSIVQDSQNSSQLINRAKQLYQDEQYTEANMIWQQAVAVFRERGDVLNQAMALSNLALTQHQLGDLTAAEGAIAQSGKLLQTQSQTASQKLILANTLDIQGMIERSRGQSKIAFETWSQAIKIYQELDNNRAVINNQINQAQALQDLGYYRRASKILTSVQTKLTDEPNSLQKVSALLSFGNTLRMTGNLEQSQIVLQQTENIANKLEADRQKNAILLSLGNTIRTLAYRIRETQTIQTVNLSAPSCLADSILGNATAYYLQAADCYRQAALSDDRAIKIKAQLNLLSLAVNNRTLLTQNILPPYLDRKTVKSPPSPQSWGDYRGAGDLGGIYTRSRSSLPDLIATIQTNLAQLPITRATIFDRLNLVQSLICLQPNTIPFPSPIVQQCQPLLKKNLPISWSEIEREIKTALAQAEQLQDKQARAYALGYLGGIYQQTGRWTEAQQLTERALLAVDNTTAPEIIYLWQWQLGRLYKLQNKPEKALQAYNTTFEILQSLRQNLVAINPEMQFAFRDRIEPVYREQVALLLQNNPSQENLSKARDTIEALQLAELNNFFREACLDAQPQKIEQIDPKAVVIYSIILPDRLAVILSQPEKPLQYFPTKIAPQQIDRTFEDLYANLSPFLSPPNPLQPNQTFYNWLVRPLESQLEQNRTNTLVFILDGVMRSIPVASLHDGEKYLIEKYNLALTPGLQLLTSRSLASNTLETIAGGLTESRQGFSSLPSVQTEVSEISTLVPSEVLLNENFTRDRLQAQITNLPYPIVHLATHGQFSSQAEDTFLLTWDDRINVRDLDQLLQERDFAEDTPIELLILSACQTATGDKQAALGLAGVAVRSGARSTIATLWSVQDDSTAELMTQFYRALKNSEISKAEALRQAQLSLLRSSKYEHPFYWSAFVLVGNWL